MKIMQVTTKARHLYLIKTEKSDAKDRSWIEQAGLDQSFLRARET